MVRVHPVDHLREKAGAEAFLSRIDRCRVDERAGFPGKRLPGKRSLPMVCHAVSFGYIGRRQIGHSGSTVISVTIRGLLRSISASITGTGAHAP